MGLTCPSCGNEENFQIKTLQMHLVQVDGEHVGVTQEGRGMQGFSAGEAVRRVSEAIGRPVDVAVVNSGCPEGDTLSHYAAEHKELLPIGDVPEGCEVVTGSFWQGQIARHARRRLAYAVWSVLAQRLLTRPAPPAATDSADTGH